MKCKKGYKKIGDKCIRSSRNFIRSQKVLPQNITVRNIIIGVSFLLAFLWVVNPPARSAVGINLVFLIISFLVYNAKEYQDDLVGVKRNNILASVGYGIVFTFLFFLITLVVPGMSIGLPSLPASISGSLRFFLVVIVAPIVETIMFQGSLYAWVSNFDQTPSKKKKWIAIFIQALGFSLFHLGAYVSGFYMYPGFTEGMSAVMANISGFIVAFLFALIAGWFVTRDGVKNLVFVGVFHLGLNLVAFSLATAVLAVSLPLMISNPFLSLCIFPTIFISYKIFSPNKMENLKIKKIPKLPWQK